MSPLADDDIDWLLQILESEDLLEIEVEEGGTRLRVSRSAPPALTLAAAPAPQPAAGLAPQPAAQELPSDVVPVLSPMAGTFYRSPSPESPAYADVGTHVERGDVVGLIEAMKIFNEIEAPVAGTVVRILVENQASVQADQRLLLLRVGDAAEEE